MITVNKGRQKLTVIMEPGSSGAERGFAADYRVDQLTEL